MATWTPPPRRTPQIVPQAVTVVPAAGASPPPPPPPFRVVFATPLNSNTIRVFLSQEPKHISQLALDDGLMRANWVITLVAGPGRIPVVERVEGAQPQPDLVDASGTPIPTGWSLDLRVNQRLLLAATYVTIAGPAIRNALGTATMAPPPDDRDDHPGIMVARPRPALRAASTQAGIDYRYEFFEGQYRVDPRLDLDVHAGLEALKKRIIRRLITTPGGFYHLPRYGVGLRVKEPFTSTNLGRLQNRVIQQVQQEEEVADLSALVSSPAPGVLVVELRVRPVSGEGFPLILEVPEDGQPRVGV